jgi:DNA-binding response OmpR family regulator
VGQDLLLVDDDRELCTLMTEYFSGQGYRVESVNDGRAALSRVARGGLDVIILDVMLPVIQGFDVLRQIRKRSSVPIIMLTARTHHTDRIEGLNGGADDYLPKPFEPDELLARIRAVLRRAGKTDYAEQTPLEFSGLRLNPLSREVWADGATISLTTIEFDILEYLMRGAGRVVSRDELAAVLYQREVNPYERAIDVHMSHLRRKIRSSHECVIQTLRGNGYLLTSRSGVLTRERMQGS